MAAVDVNSIGLAICKETEQAVRPVKGSKAEYLEPNGIPEFGSSITTTSREPISPNRQRRKGTITDFSSQVSVEQDLTVSSFLAVIDGVVLSQWQGVPAIEATTGENNKLTLSSGLPMALPVGTILLFLDFANHTGLHKVVADAAAEAKEITVDAVIEGVEEAPPKATITAGDKGLIYVVGIEATAGDIAFNNNTLTSTTLDFTKLPLYKGAAVYIGGNTESTSFDDATGLARITKIEANLLTLDKLEGKFENEDGAEKTIRLFFGQFLRNVPVNDVLFKAHSYALEISYPELVDHDGKASSTGYEYSLGNKINTVELGMSVNDKATLNFTTFGTDTNPITEESAGWEIKNPRFTEAFSTPSDFLRLRVQGADEEGLTSFFKDMTLSINNNISAENVLAKLGPAFVNIGILNVSLSGDIVLTNPRVTEKIRNNCTCSADICLSNNDGSIYIDLPRVTLGDGGKDFAVNEKVKLSLSCESFVDESFDYSLGITYFPYLPTTKAQVC